MEILRTFNYSKELIKIFSCEYTPEQNGKIERVWGTIESMAMCLLKTAGLPESWSFVYRAAFQIENRCLHSAHGTKRYEKKIFEDTKYVSFSSFFLCQGFMYLKETEAKPL